MSPRPTALFVYYSRFEWPLRAVLRSHNDAWMTYSGYHVVRLNVAFPFDAEAIGRLPFQVVIYHLSALTLRWHPSSLAPLEPLADAFASSEAVKIAMPHDDYMLSAPLTQFLNRAKTNLLLSIIPRETWPVVYKGLDATTTRIHPILTHYFDSRTVNIAARATRPIQRRNWWLRYRAWNSTAWVGAWGQLKVRVGERARECAERRGLSTDISVDPKHTVRGDRWFAFLADARATVGVEGGSSVHDPDGSIMKAVDAYTAANPAASYLQVINAILAGNDDQIRIVALSPRHLEATATRTAQILVEGQYNGVLRPCEHYIPVKPDLSDMDAAIDGLQDDDLVASMIERAYHDVVESGRHHWPAFFKTLQEVVPQVSSSIPSAAALAAFRAMNESDRRQQWLIQAEVAYGRSPAWMRAAARTALHPIKPLFARTDGYGS